MDKFVNLSEGRCACYINFNSGYSQNITTGNVKLMKTHRFIQKFFGLQYYHYKLWPAAQGSPEITQ